MGAEEKNKNEILSRIVAELFANAKGPEDLPAKINRLSDELKKVIESEDTIFGKFRGLVESFREIIPEEKQRYNAALKALSTTSKLSREEIVKAVNGQLEELKILEKGLTSAHSGWRGELKAMEARSLEMRAEAAKLRERIAQLESEEKGVLGSMAAREKEMELVEKAVGELFANIGTEITSIKKKVEEFTAVTVAPPVPPKAPVKSDIPVEKPAAKEVPAAKPVEKIESVEQKNEVHESSAPQDTEWQKKCPMCGGRMDLYSQEKKWQCYSCAYEESQTDDVQGASEERGELTDEPIPAVAQQIVSPPVVPSASASSREDPESKKEPTPSYGQAAGKKKNCPVCHKKMTWYYKTKTWRCPFCQYEKPN